MFILNEKTAYEMATRLEFRRVLFRSYLHKEALDFILDSGETLRGHALNEEVSVYKQPTKNSTALKSYQKGHALKYERSEERREGKENRSRKSKKQKKNKQIKNA